MATLTLLLAQEGVRRTVLELAQLASGPLLKDASPSALMTRLYRALASMVEAGIVERSVREEQGRPVFAFRVVRANRLPGG